MSCHLYCIKLGTYSGSRSWMFWRSNCGPLLLASGWAWWICSVGIHARHGCAIRRIVHGNEVKHGQTHMDRSTVLLHAKSWPNCQLCLIVEWAVAEPLLSDRSLDVGTRRNKDSCKNLGHIWLIWRDDMILISENAIRLISIDRGIRSMRKTLLEALLSRIHILQIWRKFRSWFSHVLVAAWKRLLEYEAELYLTSRRLPLICVLLAMSMQMEGHSESIWFKLHLHFA